ncbi:MAG: DUF547 domain-containing protein [Deltaproteobacteria bacterium]|nr:DUF547 domain-containing protein [Deltaproteobacteria bacterium]
MQLFKAHSKRQIALRSLGIFLLVGLLVGVAAWQMRVRAQPQLWKRAERESIKTFDASLFEKVLLTYVYDEGKVNYGGLKRNPENIERFASLIANVRPNTFPASFPTRADQLAYYLNAHNAFTLLNVVDRWPELTSA